MSCTRGEDYSQIPDCSSSQYGRTHAVGAIEAGNVCPFRPPFIIITILFL